MCLKNFTLVKKHEVNTQLRGTASKNSAKNDEIFNRHKASEDLNKTSSSKITITSKSQCDNALKVKLEEFKNENDALKRKLAEFEQRFEEYKVKFATEKEEKEKALEMVEKLKANEKYNFKGI